MSLNDRLDKEYDSLVNDSEGSKKLAEREKKGYDIFVDKATLALRDDNTRLLVIEILNWAGLTNPAPSDTDRALYAEGRRSIGWQVKALLDTIDPKLYPQLLIEGVDYEKALSKLV